MTSLLAALRDGRRFAFGIGSVVFFALFVFMIGLEVNASAAPTSTAAASTAASALPSSSPTPSPTPAPVNDQPTCSANRSLRQWVENLTFSAPFKWNGSAVAVPAGTGNRYEYDESSGRVAFCVDIEEPGAFILEASVVAPDTKSDSFFVEVDGVAMADPSRPSGWHLSTDRRYKAQPVSRSVANGVLPNFYKGVNPIIYDLDAGEHTIDFIQRESGAGLRWMQLVRLSYDRDPVAPTCVPFDEVQQAEDGSIQGFFIVDDGYLTSAAALGSNYPRRADTYAEYCITVAEAGTYELDATTMATSNISDSFAIEIVDTDVPAFTWHLPQGPNPITSTARTSWTLAPGDYTVRIYLREAATAMDSFVFTGAPTQNAPVVVADPLAPLPVMACAATFDRPFVNVTWLASFDDSQQRPTGFEIFAVVDGELIELGSVDSGRTSAGVEIDARATFAVRSVRDGNERDGLDRVIASGVTYCNTTGSDIGDTMVPLTCTQELAEDGTLTVEWVAIRSLTPDRWLINRVEESFVLAGDVDGEQRSFVIENAPTNIQISLQAAERNNDGELQPSVPQNCAVVDNAVPGNGEQDPLAPFPIVACVATVDRPDATVAWLVSSNDGPTAERYQVLARVDGELIVLGTRGGGSGQDFLRVEIDADATFAVRATRQDAGGTRFSPAVDCEVGGSDASAVVFPVACTTTQNPDGTALVEWSPIASLTFDQWLVRKSGLGPLVEIGRLAGSDTSFVVDSVEPLEFIYVVGQTRDGEGSLTSTSLIACF